MVDQSLAPSILNRPLVPGWSGIPSAPAVALGPYAPAPQTGPMSYQMDPLKLGSFEMGDTGFTGVDPSAPVAPSGTAPDAEVRPVPMDRLSGKEWLKGQVARAMRSVPGEKASDMSIRLKKLAAVNSKLDGLPETMDLPTAQNIWNLWYTETSGDTANPSLQPFSPEARAELDKAFAPSPHSRYATINDAPKSEIMAALGYGLAGLLGGRGFGDGLKAFSMVRQRALQEQGRYDEQAAQQEQLARAKALEIYHQYISEQNQAANMASAEAAGNRALDRQIVGAQLDQSTEELKAKLQLRNLMVQFLGGMKGDSSRQQYVRDWAKANGIDLAIPEDAPPLPETHKEQVDNATVASKKAGAQYTGTLAEHMAIVNARDLKTFNDVVAKVHAQSQIEEVRLKGELEKLKVLPDKLRADIAVSLARVASARATAYRAMNPRASGGRASTGAVPQSVKVWGTQFNQLDKLVDNEKQLLISEQSELKGLESQRGYKTMTFGAQSQEVQAINGEVARLQSSVSQRREKIMRHSVQMEKLSERMFGTPQEEAPKHTAQGGVKS